MKTVPLITRIHASPTMAVIVVTGGGAQAIADLLAVPGASKTVLEALVPYSERSLTEFLGTAPMQAVSMETAATMARAAHQRALRLREEEITPVLGLSCTATLATNRPKKGDHRAHLGLCNGEKTQVYSLILTKGARDRQEEERVVSNLLLNILAETCNIESQDDIGLLPAEQLNVTIVP
ncbi:MAG: CinA family protein [Deltaproteobacteria bacterium]|nr:CinA family protein [Deltaproteobacteria bacterium]